MKHKVSSESGKLTVDGEKLITYHYHEFEMKGNSYFPTGWKLPQNAKKLLYDPYFKLVQKSMAGKLW
jgi:hypothetical protein